MRPFHILLTALVMACAPAGQDTDTDTDTVEVVESSYSGSYDVIVGVVPVGNLPIPMIIDITARVEDGQDIITLAEFRADGDAGPSEVLASVSEVTVGDDGSFVFDLGEYTLPAAYAPLGSDLQVAMVLTGQFDEDGGICGDVTGQIVTLGLSLDTSTFGGLPAELEADTIPASCDDDGGGIDRIEAADCPVLAPGNNTAFPSAGDERSFIMVTPDDYDAANSYPIVFLYHGFGGVSSDFLSATMETTIKEAGMIGIVPQAGDLGGANGFDVVGVEANNKDLAMFDDVLTCAADQYSIDSNRIYATGMSNGGLFTGVLIANRSDVLASAAPLSGGITTATPESYGLPTLATWGGPLDEAYEQDFHVLSNNMIDDLLAQGAFVTACEHDLEHEYRDSWWSWVFEFLLDHPADITESPYTAGLPESFPEWCEIAE